MKNWKPQVKWIQRLRKNLLYMGSLDKAAASLKPVHRQHAHEIPKTQVTIPPSSKFQIE